MKRVQFAVLVSVCHLALLFSATAEEGMWTLDHFPRQKVEEAYGVEVSDEWLQAVQLSTVRFGGECTGSFVSPEGLVLTNNHCVWRCVRNLSSAERNLSETGFYAAKREEELACPRLRLSVLMGTEEVTDQVTAATAGKSEVAANEARTAELLRLKAACEETSGGKLSCESVALYHGGQYYLYKYKHYDDVRLVFAPELEIAAFGGDPDNFSFPRWCLDMSFVRVYEDGQPASTPHYFSWRASGPEAGEVVFVPGHPQSTRRLLTVAELDAMRDHQLPQQLILYSEERGRLTEWSRTSEEAERIYSQRVPGLENLLKTWRYELASLQDDEQMAAKAEEERALREAVAADPELAAAYGDAWDQVGRALAAADRFGDRYRFVEAGYGFPGNLYSYARMLVRNPVERVKPQEERMWEFQDLAAAERWLLAEVPIPKGFETLRLAFSLDKMREWLGPDDPVVRRVLATQSPDDLAKRLVEGTRVGDAAFRKELWEGGAEAVAASDDPMIQLARSVDVEARALRKRHEEEVEAPLAAAAEKIAHARFAVLGTSSYPDATFTLRLSYGRVEGWTEKGEEVPPFTTLARLYERATGQEPFRLPASWRDHRQNLDPATRFNLVASVDIVGGNSGSPLVDAEGRLVGLVFDGNRHSIAGSYWFDGEVNRTVAVHPTVMLEALDEVYGAKALLEELKILP